MLDLITHYYENPINKRSMDNADVFWHEGNAICGDDITVYIKVSPYGIKSSEFGVLSSEIKIEDWSYDGNTSMITTAAASFFSELVVGKSIQDILYMTYENTMIPEGFEVTPRRKRAGAIAILATRNALHKHLEDGKVDTRDDIVEL